MKILVIEDDQRLLRLILEVLESEGHEAEGAEDGNLGFDMAMRGIYDVSIIDWMLPGRDGPSICRGLRARGVETRTLILTARGQVEDRVTGLDSGADDYLVKPFAFEELLARLRALSRRSHGAGSDPWELRSGDLVMDMKAHTARRADQPLDLTKTEWTLLEFLMRHPGQALTRQQVLDYVWSYDRPVQPNMVDVYISYLRKKLDLPRRPDPIETVRGVGYRLKADHV